MTLPSQAIIVISMSGNMNEIQTLNRPLTAILRKDTSLIYVINEAGVIMGAEPVTAGIIMHTSETVTDGVILRAGPVKAKVIWHAVPKHIGV